MGKESNYKALRKQIRVVVAELLPELISSEVIVDVEKRLTATMLTRLAAVDERQKDMHNLLVRASVDTEVKNANPAAVAAPAQG